MEEFAINFLNFQPIIPLKKYVTTDNSQIKILTKHDPEYHLQQAEYYGDSKKSIYSKIEQQKLNLARLAILQNNLHLQPLDSLAFSFRSWETNNLFRGGEGNGVCHGHGTTPTELENSKLHQISQTQAQTQNPEGKYYGKPKKDKKNKKKKPNNPIYQDILTSLQENYNFDDETGQPPPSYYDPLESYTYETADQIISSVSDVLGEDSSASSPSQPEKITTTDTTSTTTSSFIEDTLESDILTSIENSETLNQQTSSNLTTSIPFLPNLSCIWLELSTPIIFCLIILFSSLAKYVFHLLEMTHLPESCFLTTLGIIIGLISNYYFTGYDGVTISFTSHTFFLYILPPIVFESGYYMPKMKFFDNLSTILLFSIPGTLMNALGVGFCLYLLNPLFNVVFPEEIGIIGNNISLVQYLLFGTCLAAVDPVAVVTTFEELNVNFVLYMCVFGESLLNDGVAVALFKIFSDPNIEKMDSTFIISKFVYVGLGGVIFGYIFGMLISFITKFTSDHVRLFEPFLVISLAYICYLIAELVGMSAILAVVTCGFSMRSYVEHNIHEESHDTFKYSIKSTGCRLGDLYTCCDFNYFTKITVGVGQTLSIEGV